MDNRAAKTIMVVDDEAHILAVVRMKLENAGYTVVTCEDGEEAFAEAKAILPDLIVTDYQMPFMSGLEMCEQLKLVPETSEIPVLMLTARGFSLSQDDLAKTNIIDVLSKPFSPREILERVESVVFGGATQK